MIIDTIISLIFCFVNTQDWIDPPSSRDFFSIRSNYTIVSNKSNLEIYNLLSFDFISNRSFGALGDINIGLKLLELNKGYLFA